MYCRQSIHFRIIRLHNVVSRISLKKSSIFHPHSNGSFTLHGIGTGMGNDGYLYYTMYYRGTGTHCFLLCPCLSLSLSESPAVCMSHKFTFSLQLNSYVHLLEMMVLQLYLRPFSTLRYGEGRRLHLFRRYHDF